MRILIVLLISLLSLTGCAEWKAAKSAVGNYGQQAADESVDVTLWSLCNAETVGSIRRKFNTKEKMDTYNDLCSDRVEGSLEPIKKAE